MPRPGHDRRKEETRNPVFVGLAEYKRETVFVNMDDVIASAGAVGDGENKEAHFQQTGLRKS